MNETDKLASYMGYKFESYLTSGIFERHFYNNYLESIILSMWAFEDLPDELPPGADSIVDRENFFAPVVDSMLNKHVLVYPHVSGCIVDQHGSGRNYCELKTSFGSSEDDLNLGRNLKFLNWWIQSYLSGIEVVKVGMRTEDGFVQKIVDCKISEIIKSKRVCLN
jgi:hypothetical protein